jgi:antirestriction protein ArdC
MALAADIADKITRSIIAELEAGTLPWVKPWGAGNVPALPKRHCGTSYRGVNILILWGAAQAAGHRSNTWMTFKQAQAYGGCVKKGEKGTQILFASRATKEAVSDAGEVSVKSFSFLKAYTVFNVEQIADLPAKFNPAPVLTVVEGGKAWDRFATQAAWFGNVPARLEHGGDKAFFSPFTDFVQMPPRESFKSEQAYFGTLAHEFTHWTGHKDRLDRKFGARFADPAYAMEELVAELGAAFAMAEIGLEPQIRADHAPYIASWLKALKADSKAIITAAAKASDALAHLCGYQPGAVVALEEEAA